MNLSFIILIMLESILNWLAATGIFISSISYHKSQSALKRIGQQQKELKQSKQYVISSDTKLTNVDFFKNKQKQKLILEVDSSKIKGIQPSTFSRTYHDFKINNLESLYFNPYTHDFMEGETGGEFNLLANKQRIKVDIRECNIDRKLLQKSRSQQINLIKGKEPVYESITFNIKTGLSMVLAGVLSYNIEQKQWLLTPSFLINKIDQNNIQSNIKQAFNFLQQKASQQKGQRNLSIFFILLMLFLRSSQLVNLANSLYKKVSKFFRKHDHEHLELDLIQEVIAKQSDRLCCPCGKTLNIVYQCRHLSSCQGCYEAANQKQCRICGADAGRVIKIFT